VLEVFQLVGAFTATLFAGAALYINIAEHPARMALEPRIAVLQWAPSYRRATLLQAPLAVMSFVCGTGAWLLNNEIGWLVAALLIGAVVPFTFIAVMPTNRRLLDATHQVGSTDIRALLKKWNGLHSVRTLLSLVSALLYLWLLRAA
jgi:hypothetical protein